MSAASLASAARAFKALSHPARLRILAMLGGGELCVCQVRAVLGLAYSTVSAHLAELRRAGLVAERKQGKWVHYRLAGDTRVRGLLAFAAAATAADQAVRYDANLLRRLRGLSAEELCRVDPNHLRPGVAGGSRPAGRRATEA